ncbi:transporter substrate-binding domain-containing protein [Chitinivorax sp. B]|uniref:substrate-binding periplasmic protein n=1 Tax=Chitinivorax sp. B TaxID=2502235 RepID=UPI001485AD2E|nr:transporter substrate-binding domain-containing protein [Chitinivorax sp. B]
MLLTIGTVVHASDTVRLASGEWPPLMSQQLPHFGVGSLIVTEAFAQVGIKTDYGFFSWRRSFELARNGSWDGTPLWKSTPDRQRDFYISDVLLTLPGVLFHRLGRDFHWRSIADLEPYRLGITHGYSYGSLVDEAVRQGRLKVVIAENDERAMRLLAKGMVDIVPMTLPVGQQILHKNFSEQERAQIEISLRPYLIEHFCLLLTRRIPGNAQRIQKFNEGLRKMITSGRLDQLRNEAWGGIQLAPLE